MKARTAKGRLMKNPLWPFSCVTPAGTSNELDVQNGWEENTWRPNSAFAFTRSCCTTTDIRSGANGYKVGIKLTLNNSVSCLKYSEYESSNPESNTSHKDAELTVWCTVRASKSPQMTTVRLYFWFPDLGVHNLVWGKCHLKILSTRNKSNPFCQAIIFGSREK